MLFRQLLFIFFIHNTAGYLINYYFHKSNGEDANACVNLAISKIVKDTCLVFQHNPNAHNAILFLQSRRCGFQESNTTVHLGSNCITSESCTQFVHNAITGEKKHHSTAIRNLNIKYNCTDKCSIDCQNGGTAKSDCTCKCSYGFTGTHCEHLKLGDQYTDPSCGFIEADSSGIISLKNPTEKDTFCQWILRSENAFHTFELEIEQLELDDENIPLGQHCGNFLYVSGVKNISNPIPCDVDSQNEYGKSKLIGKKFRSESHQLLIEYRGNQLSTTSHKGPIFKYTIINELPYNNEFPSLKYEHVSAGVGSKSLVQFGTFINLLISTMFFFIILC